jgi:hypothetical protein
MVKTLPSVSPLTSNVNITGTPALREPVTIVAVLVSPSTIRITIEPPATPEAGGG